MKLLKQSIVILLIGFFHHSSFGQELKALETKIDGYIKPYLEMNAWSGSIHIYQNGNPIFQKGYGYADKEWEIKNSLETKFRIASISKVFTEVAVLHLVENGEISLDDTLSQYFLDYPRGNEISIRQLLTHRSGIPHLNSFPNYNELNKFAYDLEEIIELFKHKPLDFEPGQRYSYSNSGYVLLAAIIEKVSGLSYEEFLEVHIYNKIGLRNTGVDSNAKILKNRARGYMFDEYGKLINAEYVDMSIKIGGGSLYSTADDLHKFVQSLIKGQLLTSTLAELPNFGSTDGAKVFTANGRVQGFCHQITHRIEEDLTIIILGNHYSNIALPIAQDIYQIYSDKEYKIPVNYLARKIDIASNELIKYEGTYDFGFGPVGTVKVIDGNLGYLAPGRKTYDILVPIDKNKFFYIQSWVILEFKNPNKESFNTLEWIMGENAYPAKKIN
ncbi:serine hydrolase domain-containing protein [Sediminicola sp. YIK13]|uniref:serine hydrolase domain-containing protein n=1 Tax=Sediminicola sp. YIK13 TaxID=1453352 RepID=UPI000784E40A|nr:serine hydrolase domain-containing protein [Sediminicola sp. YIK13]